MKSQTYEADFVAWTAETAQLIRAGKFEQVDWEHVAAASNETGLPLEIFPAEHPYTTTQFLTSEFLPSENLQ
ncbi:MAG: DUF29 domain-containing protein [Leptolyngbyaceae cyanobacterium RU_5_1]|nr:DUF29 domain-containing protein [Leptolyngbyaceae cyanobacterium RU_5_1]